MRPSCLLFSTRTEKNVNCKGAKNSVKEAKTTW